ncbi:hypothetical protein GCM10009825_40010 [Arthrobacter humicola]|uniref:DUF3039 domain-containing protein n=3 Tax=Actinomycetes TaxID=1760 RepID=A0ABP5LFW6_9MICC
MTINLPGRASKPGRRHRAAPPRAPRGSGRALPTAKMGVMTSMTDPLENDPMRELSGAGTSTATIEREELRQEVEPGDRERFSHYVRKEKIMESALTGEPVIALCGKVWTPGRDPQKFPVCPECKEVYEGLRPGNDGGKGSGDK